MLLTRSLSSAIREAFRADFTSGFLDPRINFSRTTNATVTNSAGVITYAPHNLLTYSEQFDNAAWVKARVAISANTILAPNGTLTADIITEDLAVSDSHQISRNITTEAVSYTYSIYFKANTRNWAALWMGGAGAYFDLNTGSVGTVSSGVTASISNAGNGWYRCSTTRTMSAASNAFIVYMATANNTVLYTGDGTSGLYIWGAQLEIGSTATAYNSTTVKNLLGYSELFDNAAWTKSNSFVQTNLLTYSEAFDNAAWAKTTITATANSIVAPNGYQTADTLAATGVNSTALQTFTAAAVPYTYSVYLYRKTGTGNIDITVDGATWVTKVITAGWTRVDTTLTPAAGSKTAGIRIVTSGDEIYAWGTQLVQGSVVGDYRRTDAAALPVYYPNHNGVVCAEKLVENTATAGHYIQASSSLGLSKYTVSIYAKKAENNYLWIRIDNLSFNKWVYFNLDLGTTYTTETGITYSITPEGNGFYRCNVTWTVTTAGTGIVFFGTTDTEGAPSHTGDGTSGIYIFGAQLSDSASLDPYVVNAAAAPTAAAYYGARFDYDPVTLAPKGLLIEEQRSNMLLNSAIAGTNLATQNVTVTAVAHTLTFYGTGNIVLSGTASATLTGTGAYPTRSTLTFTPTAGTLTLTVTGAVQYAQLEIGSFATSFIPTATSQVTRAADVATIQGSNFYSWYNQNEGSVFVNGNIPTDVDSPIANYYFSITDGTTSNLISVVDASGARSQVIANSVLQYDSMALVSEGQLKGVLAFNINNMVFCANTTIGTVDTSCTPPIVNKFVIGKRGDLASTSEANGHIKQISYYSQRLSNDVLKGLTA
jgi:hypothetical protein